MIPSPSTATEKRSHGNAYAERIAAFFFQSPATAMLKGTAIAANPRNRMGGCITIQMF